MISFGVGTVGEEDYFSTFQDISELARNLGITHKYISVTASVVGEDESPYEHEELHHDEQTIYTVRRAIAKALQVDVNDGPVLEVIQELYNAGILFRERPNSRG
jgi:hypothetical protein